MRKILLVVLIVVGFWFFGSLANAETKTPPFEPGLTAQEVIHAFGQPVKIAKGVIANIKWQSWTMADGRTIRFLEGKTIDPLS